MTQAAAAADVRKWAQSVGIPVASRGRLAPDVRQAFTAAHAAVNSDPKLNGSGSGSGSGKVNQPRMVHVAPVVGATAVRKIRARRS